MNKLTKQQIVEINKLKTVNERKNYTQNLVIQEFLKVVKGCFTAFTGYGKGMLLYKIISLFNKNKPDYRILIIVPKIDLKNDIERDIIKYGFKNVDIFVVNTLANIVVKKQVDTYYQVVLCDELHNLCNDSSVYFSQIIPHLQYIYFLGVSATLSNEHQTYLKQYGLELFFDIPLETGYLLNLTPDYNIINLSVDLTDKEKQQYIALQQEYLSYVNKFSQHDLQAPIQAITACLSGKLGCKYKGVFKTGDQHASDMEDSLGMNKGSIIGCAIKWRNVMVKRKQFLNNSVNSLKKTVELINYINDQILIFCPSIEIANLLAKNIPNSAAYHSKLSKKVKEKNKLDFTENKLKCLFVINSMKEGFSYNRLSWIIRIGFNSKVLDLTQILGRGLRFDENNKYKVTNLIHVYVKDFEYNGVKYESQNFKWLKNALRNRSFCEYVDDIKEIKI